MHKGSAKINEHLITEFSFTSDIITAIRDFRKEHDISTKESLEISFRSSADDSFCIPVVQKMANLSGMIKVQNSLKIIIHYLSNLLNFLFRFLLTLIRQKNSILSLKNWNIIKVFLRW